MLEARCAEFLAQGLAVNSRRTYATGQRKFWQFCNLYPSLWANSSPLPASERLLMLFVSWLAQSLSPASVVVYLASVRSLHIDQGFPDPTLHTPRLRRVIQGIRRSASRSRPPRRPITRPILQAIHAILAHATPATDALMFWAACCVAFFGFLRVSEFTSTSPFDLTRHLSFFDAQFLPGSPSPALRLRIKSSKTDQLRQGCFVYIGRSGHSICAVDTLLAYVNLRGSSPGPLFQWQTGNPLTPAQVNACLKDLVSRAGFSGNYSSHSFRIGAATAAAEAGIPAHLIQTLGRWSSSAYLLYVHSSPDTIARVAPLL